MFSPIVRAILANTENSINFRELIDNHGGLIVNLKPSIYFSEEQGETIGGLIINEIIATVRATESPGKCRRHYLIIDEASRFVGQDLIGSLKQDAKRKLSVCLAGQDFSAFRKQDVDMVPDLCGNTWSFISFQQKENENVEELAKFFLLPNVILEERNQPMVFPKDPKFIKVRDTTTGESEGCTQGTSRSSSKGGSLSETEGKSNASTSHWSEGHSLGESYGEGHSAGTGLGSGMSQHAIIVDGEVVGWVPARSTHQNRFTNRQSHRGRSESESSSTGGAETTGESHGTTRGKNWSETEGVSESTDRRVSRSMTEKTMQISQHEIKELPTGHPRLALDYQQARVANLLTTLPVGRALLRTTIDGRHGTYLIHVREISEPYPKPRHKELAIKEIKQALRKPYHTTPMLDDDSQDARIDRFLGRPPDEGTPPLAAEPADDQPFSI